MKEERPGRPKIYGEELEAIFYEYCFITQEELTKSLEVTQGAISKSSCIHPKAKQLSNITSEGTKP